jgi:hypothetical protein
MNFLTNLYGFARSAPLHFPSSSPLLATNYVQQHRHNVLIASSSFFVKQWAYILGLVESN